LLDGVLVATHVRDRLVTDAHLDELYLDVIKQRRDPSFYIDDEGLRAILAPAGAWIERPSARSVPAEVIAVARRLLADGFARHARSAVAMLRSDTILRLIRLDGVYEGCYAIFLEPFLTRYFRAGAASRFELSLREVDVLQLLMKGDRYSAIARKLFIAESTVQAHIRNIARKTASRNRKEIVATVLGIR
jgi:DNA-binding CsgD family transcriptional regulator